MSIWIPALFPYRSRSNFLLSNGLTAFALFYPPKNKDFIAPARRTAAADCVQSRWTDGRDNVGAPPRRSNIGPAWLP